MFVAAFEAVCARDHAPSKVVGLKDGSEKSLYPHKDPEESFVQAQVLRTNKYCKDLLQSKVEEKKDEKKEAAARQQRIFDCCC